MQVGSSILENSNKKLPNLFQNPTAKFIHSCTAFSGVFLHGLGIHSSTTDNFTKT